VPWKSGSQRTAAPSARRRATVRIRASHPEMLPWSQAKMTRQLTATTTASRRPSLTASMESARERSTMR
jgi:hypothetical protein